jgi:type II secretory pathway component PulF
MPKFQYSATDSQGAPRIGEIDAPTQNDAIRLLSSHGFQVTSITGTNAPIAPTRMPVAQPAPAPAPARPTAIPPPQPVTAAPILTQRSSYDPAAPLRPLPVTHTKVLSNKELYLYFIQLSNLLRSGISPSEAFQQLARRPLRPDVAEASTKMAAWTTEGRGIHEAMAAYPDLFPTAVRGAMESGALGGYLWEAAEMVAEQRRSTHAIQRALWYVWWAFLSLFGSVIVGLLGQGAVKGAIKYVNDGQGTLSEAVGLGFQKGLLGITGIVVGISVVTTIILRYWFRSKPSRPMRHRMAFRLPMVKKRTINENFTHFSWHLGKLARAGISPFSSYQVAAKAVPNDAYSEELLRNAANRPDTVRLSSILYQSSLFPHEYAATVETGEIAGRIGEALDQASALSLQEVKEQEKYVKWRVGCWAGLAFVLSGLIGFGILYRTYLYGAFDIIKDTEDSLPVITHLPDIRR